MSMKRSQPGPDFPRRLRRLSESHGALHYGTGLATGITALLLAILCLLAVLAFHFPQYLTTPDLRKLYGDSMARHLLLLGLVLAGALSLMNLVFQRLPWLAATAFALVVLAALLGGHQVPVGDFADGTLYVGLDFFILDLLGSALIFIFIEKLFALKRDQPVFRPEWQTDLQHFAVNHMLIGFLLLASNLLVHRLFGWAANDGIRGWVAGLPFWVALLLLLFLSDLLQYWLHRAYHRVPWLWRLHAVHHSVKTMDWLAGSRLHLLEVLITRTLVLGLIYVAGFAKGVIDAYIVIVGFQAVFNHANVSVRLGPLRYLIVTPNFHHWHHSRDEEALDRNFAAHFACIDHLFGTAVQSDKVWPDNYGVVGDYVPPGLLAQSLFPFRGGRNSRAPAAADKDIRI